MTDEDLESARANGRTFGSRHEGSAQNCPYEQRDIRMRLAWFDGFSEGRAELERKTGTIAAGPGTKANPAEDG